jgi:hypothetical protein
MGLPGGAPLSVKTVWAGAQQAGYPAQGGAKAVDTQAWTVSFFG